MVKSSPKTTYKWTLHLLIGDHSLFITFWGGGGEGSKDIGESLEARLVATDNIKWGRGGYENLIVSFYPIHNLSSTLFPLLGAWLRWLLFSDGVSYSYCIDWM